MKVLLLKDVYKLGRAGDVKRVADGYGRNYLIPHGLAVLATPGALKQAERIRAEADSHREALNREMSAVTEKMAGLVLAFPARASETGKLYGSITSQMIADAISERIGEEISRRSIDTQPLRTLGEHKVHVRLTVDLVPEITVIVHREGESPNLGLVASTEGAEPAESAPEALEVPESDEAEEAVGAEDTEASQVETAP